MINGSGTYLNEPVDACLAAKIAFGEVIRIDSSLLRANVSWDSLVERYVERVLEENEAEETLETKFETEKDARQAGRYKKVFASDPDATMVTTARNRAVEPAYKQHTAVDDKMDVVLDVEITTGQTSEGEIIDKWTGCAPRRVSLSRQSPPMLAMLTRQSTAHWNGGP